MCATCGCSAEEHAKITRLGSAPETTPLRALFHDHSHEPHGEVLSLERRVLEKNDHIAEHIREWLGRNHVLELNLVSSPGAGKTTLLERTIRDLRTRIPLQVIEGDQQTLNDARRIAAVGAPVVQVNTGKACHLDANMISRALAELGPAPGTVVLVENVGNLVCPALFDLGEHAKVAIVSVTEGDDKPLKYPYLFRASQLMILNKIDLLPYVSFDVDRCVASAREVNPRLEVLRVSATRGDGLPAWYQWIEAQRSAFPPPAGGAL